VEADTDHIEIELTCTLQQARYRVERSAKLESKLASALRVVGENAHHQLARRVVALHLFELVDVVEGGEADIVGGSVADKTGGFARVCVDYPSGIDAKLEDSFDLTVGSTVEASAKPGKELQHVRVRVALDRVEGNDTRQSSHPTKVLAVDFGEIRDEEGVLSVGLAAMDVNVLENALQLRVEPAVVDGLVAVERLDVVVLIVERRRVGSQVRQSDVRSSHRRETCTSAADWNRLLRVTGGTRKVQVKRWQCAARHDWRAINVLMKEGRRVGIEESRKESELGDGVSFGVFDGRSFDCELKGRSDNIPKLGAFAEEPLSERG